MSTSSRLLAGNTGPVETRSVAFAEHGQPAKVLRGLTYTLPPLAQGQVRVRFELSAVNPADINVIQGVYPQKPEYREDVGGYIMGNEGTGIVQGIVEDGEVEHRVKLGDRVVMGRPQQGTWSTHANLPLSSLIVLPESHPISPTQAATLSINPPTALRLLSDFYPLNPEQGAEHTTQQWVIQNGANSAVGVAVIQLAKSFGVKTINLVRDREDIHSLKNQLRTLGADYVLTYDEFLQRDTRTQIKEWLKGGELKLALNCVGGKETTEMVKLLSNDGCLVTYGGMAKVPLSVPPSLFIFKNLSAKGFWLSNWTRTHTEERIEMMNQLAKLCSTGQLKEPETEIVDLPPDVEGITTKIRSVMERSEGGKGKKILLRFC